jgi:hypothetical protein
MPPETAAPATDENGFITEGPFAGMHVNQALTYAQALHQTAQEGGEGNPPPKPPATKLEEHASNRVDNTTLLTWARLEADDESAFSADVDDYDEFKEDIDKIKKSMHPAQRIQRGFHAMLYQNVKLQRHPELAAQLRGKKAAAPVDPVDPEPEDGEETIEDPTPPPAPVVAKPKPKAVPPATAKSTPAARTAPAAPKGPKIEATDKIRMFAKGAGMSVEDYIAALVAKGMTQDDIDRLSVPRPAVNATRRSIYDAR